jgi:hypothetical protein
MQSIYGVRSRVLALFLALIISGCFPYLFALKQTYFEFPGLSFSLFCLHSIDQISGLHIATNFMLLEKHFLLNLWTLFHQF